MKIKKYTVFFVLVINIFTCFAQNEKTSTNAIEKDTELEKTGFTFRSFRPTQFLRSFQISNIVPDAPHFQMNLSPEFHFKVSDRSTCGLVYNCEYGFYMGTLYSGPVLSRLQNPFCYYEYNFGKYKIFRGVNGADVKQHQSKFGFVVAHESNGMMADNAKLYKSLTNQFTDFGIEESEMHNFNSMGWNYLGLWYKRKILNSIGIFKQGEYGFEYRMYVNQAFGIGKNDDFWHLENNLFLDTNSTGLKKEDFDKITIRNYDGFRFNLIEEMDVANKKKTVNKFRVYYQILTGFPLNYDWFNADAYKISQRLTLSYGWQWKEGWGSVFLVSGFEEGYRKYLSTYPCYRSCWYFGIQMGF